VESTPTHATPDENRVLRINEILAKLSQGFEYIGDFHSHTAVKKLPATVLPSGIDPVSSVPGELSITCSVNLKKKSVACLENHRGILTGTGGKYRIEIGAIILLKPALGGITNEP
jgi:hypothetical protein